MVKKGGFTLIEIIFVIVISAILSMGTFKAVEALYIRTAKAKAVTDMTLRSQIVLDQIGVLLYNRVPNSVIGYSTSDNTCEAISDLTDSRPVLEWFGTMDDKLVEGKYDGFIDMGASDRANKVLVTPYMYKKFDDSGVNLIFAGAFDSGEDDTKACKGAFGWHNNDSNISFDIDVVDENRTKITGDQPKDIYEKYYLTHSAYAVTRGEELNQKDLIDNCKNYSSADEMKEAEFNNTLFLFYDYRPYDESNNKDVTFCGDNTGTREGNVSILAKDISAFEAVYENDVIRLNIDMNKSIKGSTYVHIYKQKVVF